MKHYTEFKFIEYPTVKSTKKIEYIDIPCAFDIETTSMYVGDEKFAFMYIWQFGLGDQIVYGRTWDEFIELCTKIQEFYKLSDKRQLYCYVHNLSFEFQFMRKYFTWTQFLASAERKPILALCEYGIMFKDSYILSGYNLAYTAKNLTSHTIEKLSGDLNYTLIRHSDTPLTDTELKYCEYDIQIILYYIDEQKEQYGNIYKIPNTNTGRVRREVRNACLYTSKTHKKTDKKKYTEFRKLISNLTLNVNQYEQLKRAFQGGYTHANPYYENKILDNVASIDFTSSYPAVMLSEKFPMSRPIETHFDSEHNYDYYAKRFLLVFDVEFENIEPTFFEDNYISESRCNLLKNPICHNGRVYSAEKLQTTLTNIDFDIIKSCYKWTKCRMCNVHRFFMSYLPKSICECILKLYGNKTTLKGVKGSEVEYLNSKGMLNSVYGMCVTDIVKDIFDYKTSWTLEQVDRNEKISDYNTDKKRFLYYAWGVFVTAYARRNLWRGIYAIGHDYIYSDTDSIKMLNYDKHLQFIENYNDNIYKKLCLMCDFHKFDKSLIKPKTIKGIEKIIGVWDYEGTYTKFKTLGAKRYLVEENGEHHITVAGLPKGCIKYIESLGNVFDVFTNDLYIPKEYTGKMTHTYIDDEKTFEITDYKGNTKIVNSLSGTHLEVCDFTLSMANAHLQFIEDFMNGHIYKGVTLC